MKLTALEIKKQQFEKSLRGYDKGEVDAFLQLVSSEWEHMVAKIREMEVTLGKYEERIKHFERVEGALHETLQTAKDSADEKLINARKQAQNILQKAEMDAEATVKEAHQQRKQVRQDMMRLLERREEMINSIRSYLELSQQALRQFSSDEASLFSVPPEDQGVADVGRAKRSSGRGGSAGQSKGGRSAAGRGDGGAGRAGRAGRAGGASGAGRYGGTEAGGSVGREDPEDLMDDIIDDLE